MPRYIIVGLGILGVWVAGCGGQSGDEQPAGSGTSGVGGTSGMGGMSGVAGASDVAGATETAGMSAAAGAPPMETTTCDALDCENGELSGTWRFVQACPVDYAENWDTLPSDCEQPRTHEVYSGTLTFNADGTVTENYTVASSQSRIISSACAQATNGNGDLSDSACAAFDRPENQLVGATVCSYQAGSCRCEWSLGSGAGSGTTAYSRDDYCLQGDELTLAIKEAQCDQCAGMVQVGTAHLQRVP